MHKLYTGYLESEECAGECPEALGQGEEYVDVEEGAGPALSFQLPSVSLTNFGLTS